MSAKRCNPRVLRVAALTTLIALLAPSVHAKKPNVPFKASLITQETLGFNPVACPTTFLQGTTVASGNATHMGSVTLRSTDCVVQADGQLTFTDGRLVLTAANGDQIIATYSGMLLPTAELPVYSLSGSYTVIGGTGRFEGATGSGTLQGSSNIVTGRGGYTATGFLRY